MTPQELKDLQTSARILAVESLLATLISALFRSEAGRKSFEEMANHWLASLNQMTFPQYPAEYSDLYAAEVQQAVQSLVSLVKRNLEK
ncbi:MAG TPA: hypothetical protein VEI29_04700 [Burkholderiaceae bacterium]|nr:hypothetical protein [Burkholderiaceae bacterium]